MPAVLPSSAAADDLHLDVGELALGQVADRVGRGLRAREQDPVVVRGPVVRAVVDVGVEPVLVDAEVEDAQAHLLRRAERRGHAPVQPVAAVGAAPGNGAWPAKPAGWSYWSPNAATFAAMSAGEM